MKGRTVLIAGASSGIGEGFARVLAKAGARVVLGARRLNRCEAIVGEIVDAGGEACAVSLDVTDDASVIAAYDAAEARFGNVNAIVSA
jgi:NADP-dependent 3-hydroxy acid dehydrogenase YdfG